MELATAQMGASHSAGAGVKGAAAVDVQRLKRKASSDAEAVAELTCLQARLKLAPPLATTYNAALDAAVAELLDDSVPPVLPAVTMPAAPTVAAPMSKPPPIDTIKPIPPAAETADALPATQELPATQPAEEEGKARPNVAPPLAATRTDSLLLLQQGGTPAVPSAPASVPPSICFPSPAGGTTLLNSSLVALTPELLQQGQDWRDLQVIVPLPAAAAHTSNRDDCNSSPLGSSTLRLAGYLLHTEDGSALGSGGLGNVYRGHHLASGAEVAVKLGRDFVASEGSDDFSWWSFLTEWNVYSALCPGASAGAPWPRVYEMGLVRTVSGVAPWISMEVLGPDLHTLNRSGRITLTNLAAYGRGALAALQALHSAGYVHVDVKNANFCTRCEDGAAGSVGGSQAARDGRNGAAVAIRNSSGHGDVVLVDFGFAQAWSPNTAGERWSFVGTPDFASARCLRGSRPAPCDDLEALGFCLLELALGDLPWDVTHVSTKQDGGAVSLGWTNSQLAVMADKREAIWRRRVSEGSVPHWLVDWIGVARALPATELPGYEVFRQLLAEQEIEAAAAAAKEAAVAAKAAEAATAVHLLWAEE